MIARAPADYRVGFRPLRLLAGGHRQTLAGYALRRHLRWPHPAEDLLVEAGSGVRLLARATWQPAAATRPTLVLVHGLGGHAERGYMVSAGSLALARGWNVVRMNMRGAGPAEPLCPLLYHAGLDADVLAVLAACAERTPRLALLGFSLGANLAALAVARNPGRLPGGLLGAAAISAPLDLAACVAALGRPGNRLYELYYVRQLRRDYARLQRRRPDLYAAGREHGLATVRAYDETITAPYGGFRDADDYYARSSAGPLLASAERPLLILTALDDPMIPAETVQALTLPANGRVRLELTPSGGHLGFVARSRSPGWFWAADRALDFLDDLATLRPPAP